MVDWEREKYASLTTFRRDGSPVSVPVWIAPLADGRLCFTTDPASWKVKRVRHTPAVELRPCSVRGSVAPNAPVAKGTAEVVTDHDGYAAVASALKAKYGIQSTLVELGGRIKQLVTRHPDPECALVITLA